MAATETMVLVVKIIESMAVEPRVEVETIVPKLRLVEKEVTDSVTIISLLIYSRDRR
jgi:hypothetical protein